MSKGKGLSTTRLDIAVARSRLTEVQNGGATMLESAVHEFYGINFVIDDGRASESLDSLIQLVSELLPVDRHHYPDVPSSDLSETVTFCLHHSALHFSKTAGRLAAFVEDADHGRFDQIQALEAIVAASLVNSLKLAEEIGLTGSEIMGAVREKFSVPVPMEQQM